MNFGYLAAIGLTANLLGIGIGVALALLDFGYWALVAMAFSTEFFSMLFTWVACPWRPGRPGPFSAVREMLFFGGNLAGASFVNYISAFSDRLLIGKVFGPASLGLYDRGWQLLMLPLRQINAPLTRVAVPMLSRLQDEDDRYRNAYLTALSAILLLTTPIIAACIVLSDLIVDLVLGPGWEEVAPIFRILSVGAIALPIGNTTGWLFVSQGRTREQFKWQTVDAVFKVTLIVLGLRWGITGVAWACTIRLLVNPPALFWYVGRRGPVSIADLWSALSIAGVACAIGCVAGLAIRASMPLSSPLLMAPTTVLMSGLGCLLAFATLPRTRRVLVQLGSPAGLFG
jgi:PST family polysaccharide transporter